jgi:hypothetical protein
MELHDQAAEAGGIVAVVVQSVLSYSSNSRQAEALTELIAECDTVIFLANSQLSLPDVHVAALAANAKGKKIVNVQLGESIVVEAFEKYGCASVPLNCRMIIDAVCGDRFAWVDDDGELRAEPETERHKCKKQRPGNKNEAA